MLDCNGRGGHVRSGRGQRDRSRLNCTEAFDLLTSETVDRACLDFNLADGEVTPVLDLLASKGIPMVVYTGRCLPKELASQHPKLTVLLKPLPADRLVTELAREGELKSELPW